MKRLTAHLGALIAGVLAVAAAAVIIWVFAATSGTRWLLTTLIPLSGVSFSAQKIEGRLVDHLLLTNVQLGLAQQQLKIGRLELNWKPLLLLTGTVAVREMVINDVTIQDDTPIDKQPQQVVWPRVAESRHLFTGLIERLQVTNIRYRRQQEQPLLVTSVAAAISWQDGELAISRLKVIAPAGQIHGSFAAGFRHPSLQSDLTVSLATPLAKMDRFSLQTGQSQTVGGEQLAGTVTFSGSAGSEKILELRGELGLANNVLNLRRLQLSKPGLKGLITGAGSLMLTGRESLLSLQIMVAGLDLDPVMNLPTNLSGTLKIAGNQDRYRGDVTLANQAHGWQAVTVAAAFEGTAAGMKLAPVHAGIIGGSLDGNLALDWLDGFTLQGALSGRNLDPAKIDPAWQGSANFTATGTLALPGNASPTGSISVVLLESSLHGQALTGELQAGYAADNLTVSRLELNGKGFDLHAAGNLKQRLNLAAEVSDLSGLFPGAAGTLNSSGWVSWRDDLLSGAVTATGNNLAYGGVTVVAANLTAGLDRGADYPLHVRAALQGPVYEGYTLNAVTIVVDGTVPRHTISATAARTDNSAELTLSAGYLDGVWQGELSHLAGRGSQGQWQLTAPASFVIGADRFSLSPLVLSAGAAERLEVAANLTMQPLSGVVRAKWDDLDLARANPWLQDLQISGSSNGTVRADILSGKLRGLQGSVTGNGNFTGQGGSMTINKGLVRIAGDEQGVRVGVDLETTDGGRLHGTFSSAAPLGLDMPERGELTAEWSGIDLALSKHWLPRDTALAGRSNGLAKGLILPGKRFELVGKAGVTGGEIHLKKADGVLNVSLTAATASWVWRDSALAGTFSLATAEYGQARGDFELPLPARFPVVITSQGPLRAMLAGKFREKGLVAALFPELIQDSSGELTAQLDVMGTWEEPLVKGQANLARAGAYLPTAGIHLADVQATARLEKNLIRIESFRAVSGTGYIEGTALITLAGWQVSGYQGTVRGENFQTVFLPELRIVSTPDLSFEGTPQKLVLRGDLRLPELNFVQMSSQATITASNDVIFEGKVVPAGRHSPLIVDARIRVVLGERVSVKVAGIDARLGGAMDISMSSFAQVSSRGELKVIKGRYRTYGVDLDIVRGRLFFTGGPVERPTLDFLALRTIGTVRAGVTVAGTLRKPVIRLYSEPAMTDIDVLAYIVLGHPLGSNGQQASLVAQAAGALLTSGQAVALQEQLKNKFGLSTLEIQGGVGKSSNSMGYKPLQVTAPGAIPATQQPGITETVVTVGKYLTPQLYISYGKSLFTGSSLFRLRYDIFKQWQLETQTGSESGVDLFYKLEFK